MPNLAMNTNGNGGISLWTDGHIAKGRGMKKLGLKKKIVEYIFGARNQAGSFSIPMNEKHYLSSEMEMKLRQLYDCPNIKSLLEDRDLILDDLQKNYHDVWVVLEKKRKKK